MANRYPYPLSCSSRRPRPRSGLPDLPERLSVAKPRRSTGLDARCSSRSAPESYSSTLGRANVGVAQFELDRPQVGASVEGFEC